MLAIPAFFLVGNRSHDIPFFGKCRGPRARAPAVTASADRQLLLHLHRRSAIAHGQVFAGLEARGHSVEGDHEEIQGGAPGGGDQRISDSATTIGPATVYDVIRLPRRSIGVCGAIVSEVYGVATVLVDVGFLTG
jgi:hypothetical protein